MIWLTVILLAISIDKMRTTKELPSNILFVLFVHFHLKHVANRKAKPRVPEGCFLVSKRCVFSINFCQSQLCV